MLIVQERLLCGHLAKERHLRLRDGPIAIVDFSRMMLFKFIVGVLMRFV